MSHLRSEIKNGRFSRHPTRPRLSHFSLVCVATDDVGVGVASADVGVVGGGVATNDVGVGGGVGSCGGGVLVLEVVWSWCW